MSSVTGMSEGPCFLWIRPTSSLIPIFARKSPSQFPPSGERIYFSFLATLCSPSNYDWILLLSLHSQVSSPYPQLILCDIIKNKYLIFCSSSWHTKPKALGISGVTSVFYMLERWLVAKGSQIASEWGLVPRKTKAWTRVLGVSAPTPAPPLLSPPGRGGA